MQGVFTAGDGDLSVVYQSAAHVWGSWNVTYSEGVEPEDFETDRALGYVGDVGAVGDELASRMWVRFDVSVDQEAGTSTVPTVFRDARERTSGDVVVEREITGAGLGGLVPYVDFRHGDEIGTVIGSKVVPLPANSIEFVTDVDGAPGSVVKVGKGLLGNVRERDARNAALETQIRVETAERERQIREERERTAEEARRLEEQQERDRALTNDIGVIAREGRTTANSARSTANNLRTWGGTVYEAFDSFGFLALSIGSAADALTSLNRDDEFISQQDREMITSRITAIDTNFERFRTEINKVFRP